MKEIQIRVVVEKRNGIPLFGPSGVGEKVAVATLKPVQTERDGSDAVIVTGEKLVESDVDKINGVPGLMASLIEPTTDPMQAAAEQWAEDFPVANDKGE